MNLSRNGAGAPKIPASDSLPRAVRLRAIALVIVLELGAALVADLVATVAEELAGRAAAKLSAREMAGDLPDVDTGELAAEPHAHYLGEHDPAACTVCQFPDVDELAVTGSDQSTGN